MHALSNKWNLLFNMYIWFVCLGHCVVSPCRICALFQYTILCIINVCKLIYANILLLFSITIGMIHSYNLRRLSGGAYDILGTLS